MAEWDGVLQSVLAKHPGLTVHELRAALRRDGIEPPARHELNRHLYRRPKLFRREGPEGSLPRWSLSTGEARPSASTRPVEASGVPATLGLDLYAWQERALTAWQKSGHQGVIEAVTGAGKTRVAMAAIGMQLAAHGKVAVLVHTRELLGQWHREVARLIPPLIGRVPSIGQLGGGSRQNLAAVDVLVATAQSAAGWQMGVANVSGLLIADEVHHYGAEAWSRGLEPHFDRRLGLTATYEREDHGVENYLDPYFGGVCYSVDYEEALRDAVIAPFKIAFIGVAFSPAEAVEYEELSDKLRRRKQRLLSLVDIPEEPFGEFIKAVGKISHGTGPASRFAGLYLGAFNKRRGLLSGATGKLTRLRGLLPAIKTAERTIIFSQTQAAATAAVAQLRDPSLSGAVLHAGMDVDQRRDVFAGFEDGRHDLVAAPRLLDEGVDVPAADLAIVLASSRSKRQMIQRMGRVVRKKDDGRLARLAIFYVEGTSEDPEHGAHEDFVDIIERSASDVAVFPSTTSEQRINAYLTSMHG